MAQKPIRIFWSALSRRLYASRAYVEVKPGVIEITGQKFDVTDEIAELIAMHGITFALREDKSKEKKA